MDNVIKFPAKEIRSLARWEKLIRSGMRKAGAPKDAEDIITPELVELIKKYNSMAGAQYKVTLPVTLNEDEIKACSEALHQVAQESFENFSKIMNEVLGDLVVLRMKLYIAKGE